MTMEFNYDELVRATDGFSPARLVGKGSHGCVYMGVLEHGDDHEVMAIKTSTSSPSSATSVPGGPDAAKAEKLKKLENEIRVLSSLPKNPHVVRFLGTSRDAVGHDVSANKLMVMEFMPNGSLHHLLHAATTLPAWPKRIEIALQIARAVHFLHEEAIIHRDVKSENVLFDSSWNAKLADFGLAVSQRVDSDGQTSPPAGTMGYLDPCYTCPAKLSTKTDVFSYGVVLLEIVSCRKAIDLSRSPASIVEWAIPLISNGKIEEICGGRSATFSTSCIEATIGHLLQVAARCVSPKAESRPSSCEIVAEIGACLAEPARNLPTWISVLRGVILMKRRRKRAKRCRETLAEREVPASWVSRTGRVR